MYIQRDGEYFVDVVEGSDAPKPPFIVTPAKAIQSIVADAKQQFDVGKQFPVRLHVYQTTATEYIVNLVCHHIAADASSMGYLVAELFTNYESNGKLSVIKCL
jgi:hypothetical protein